MFSDYRKYKTTTTYTIYLLYVCVYAYNILYTNTFVVFSKRCTNKCTGKIKHTERND